MHGLVKMYVKHKPFCWTRFLRVIIWERQNQLEIEKIDFLEILPIFNFCREMNKNAYFFQIFTSVSMATTIFYF